MTKMTKPKNNPLLEKTPYKHGIPAYDLVKTEDFLPALDWAIIEAKADLDKIKNEKNPSFENVIEALENVGKSLDTVTSVFFHFDGVNSTKELSDIALEFKTKLSQYSSDFSLDAKLFEQIHSVYKQMDSLNLNPAQKMLLEDACKSFVRNGALLDDTKKDALRKIDEEKAGIQNSFGKNSLDATNSYELFVNEADLKGVPESAKSAMKEEAEEKGNTTQYLITLQYTSLSPVMQYAENRDLREKVWRASSTKCKTGAFDNKENVLKTVKLRDERAKLLGYDSHADYVLEDRMAKNKEAVFDMLDYYKKIVKPIAIKEMDELKEFAKDLDGIDDLKPWDISYYAEKMSQKLFGFDSEELKPYFKFEDARQGSFDVASKLYDIRFEKVEDLPKWHDEVESFEIYSNKTNELIGVIYTDYFPRETKRGGAWMNDYVGQSRNSDGSRKAPIIGNHGNFTKPTKNKPSLLTFNEVLTLFHEFGHGLHGLMSDTQYESQAGTNVKWDFVELPSQIMENFAKEKEVLDMFAKHYKDGSLMPEDLINKMKKSENFMAATGFLRQIQLSTLDMKWHTTDPTKIKDVIDFETEVTKEFMLTDKEGSLTSTAFSHIFAGGYSAGYYSYKWAEVLDADGFEAFKEKGLFDKETAAKFLKLISSGGSKDPEELYIEFRGKPADKDALLRRDGLLKSNENDNDNALQQNPKSNILKK